MTLQFFWIPYGKISMLLTQCFGLGFLKWPKFSPSFSRFHTWLISYQVMGCPLLILFTSEKNLCALHLAAVTLWVSFVGMALPAELFCTCIRPISVELLKLSSSASPSRTVITRFLVSRKARWITYFTLFIPFTSQIGILWVILKVESTKASTQIDARFFHKNSILNLKNLLTGDGTGKCHL